MDRVSGEAGEACWPQQSPRRAQANITLHAATLAKLGWSSFRGACRLVLYTVGVKDTTQLVDSLRFRPTDRRTDRATARPTPRPTSQPTARPPD